MISDMVLPPPFWSSRRLWLKMLLAGISGTTFLGGWILLGTVFVSGLCILGRCPDDPLSDWWALVAVLIPFAGSILMGWFLSPNWRGVVAGGAVLIAPLVYVSVAYGLGGLMLLVLPRVLSIAAFSRTLDILEGPIQFLALTLALVCQIAFLQIMIKSDLGHRKWLGLGIGGLVGVGLSLILMGVSIGLSQMLGNITIRVGSRTSGPVIQGMVLIALGALIWLSVVFFPELLARRVGWGGVLVWAGLVVAIFGAVIGLSFAFGR